MCAFCTHSFTSSVPSYGPFMCTFTYFTLDFTLFLNWELFVYFQVCRGNIRSKSVYMMHSVHHKELAWGSWLDCVDLYVELRHIMLVIIRFIQMESYIRANESWFIDWWMFGRNSPEHTPCESGHSTQWTSYSVEWGMIDCWGRIHWI